MIALTFIPDIEMNWLPLLVDATVKGLVLLLIAAGATLLLRRSSAALRHMVWTLAIVALILVPALSIALPQLQVPILPNWSGALGAGQESPSTPAESPAPNIETSPIHQTPSAVEPAGPSAELAAAPEQNGPAPVPAASTPRLHWSAWVLLAWLAGAIVLLLPLLAGTVMVWRQTRRAERVESGSWTNLLAKLCKQLGIRKRVTLLRSDWSSVPVACGIFRPAIILPAEADSWPADRRMVVLLHELGHIRRADCLIQLLARLARVIYWFNPLVWLAVRKLRIEREQACDDLVLASGHKASDYAGHLLDIVRSLHSVRCPSLAAVAMARKSQFEGRLLAILDPRRNRGAMTRLHVLIVAALTIGCAGSLAILKGAQRRPAEVKPAAQIRAEAKAEDFVGSWKGRTVDKPKEGTSRDTMTLVIPDRPAKGKWQALVLGSFAYDGKPQAVKLKLNDGKLTFRARARDGDMAVRLGLDRSGKGRLIGEANPTTNDPITSSPRGDARDIELTLEPSVRMRTGEIDIRSSPRARISNNRAAKSDPQDLLGAVLSAKTKFAEAEPLVIKLAWKALNWRAAHEGSNQPGAWDKSVSGLGWKYWRVIVNGKEYRYRDSVLNPASGLALNINLNTGLIGGPAWRPGIYRVQYIARDLPVIRLKDGRSGKIIIAKTIASNEVLFAITASQPATRPSPVPDNESKTPRDLVARKTAAFGGLQFRIAPSQSALGKGELASCMAWLKAGRIGFWWLDSRIAGIAGRMPRHAWLPFADKLSNNGQLVTGEYKGRNYVLVSDKPGQVMGPGTGKNAWALARVYAVKAGSDRPAIGFELDDRGAKLFAILTKANVGNTLAILVDGKVVSTPMLMSSLGKRGIITGSFTKQQIKDMTKALSASIPKRSSR